MRRSLRFWTLRLPLRGRALRLYRSSSLRMMLLYALGSVISAGVLLGVIAVTTDRFMTQQIDTTVTDEIIELRADAGGDDAARIASVIDDLVAHAPGFLYLLQNPQGRVLAGNMMALRPVTGLRTLSWSHGKLRVDQDAPIRGRGVVLQNGDYLFVGSSAIARRQMRLSVIRAGLWSFGVIILLGLSSGLLISGIVLRRIEAVARTANAIMTGDLSKRVPLTGSDDEFDHLSRSLNRMLAKIEALMDSMRQISNDIAHDLRTPLSHLRQRLEIASRSGGGREALQEHIDAATTQVDAILVTFSSLLRLAQLEARLPHDGFEPADLAAILHTMVDAYGPSAEERGQRITAVAPAGLMLVCDKALIMQMLANLLDNALRHTQAGSTIVVSADSLPSAVRLCVADDGPGIPASAREYVLRRFARLDTSRQTPGSGLGLNLVAAIAGVHGAALRLKDNSPGLCCEILFSRDPGRFLQGAGETTR